MSGFFIGFFFMWYFRQFLDANVNSSRVRFFGIKICICSVAKLGRDYRPTIQWEDRLPIFSSKYFAVYFSWAKCCIKFRQDNRNESIEQKQFKSTSQIG
jgi:hypothetical protein